MLYVVIAKTKYDESYNFEQAGEDEAMFDEYRKKLKVVFDNLAALIPELVLKVICFSCCFRLIKTFAILMLQFD